MNVSISVGIGRVYFNINHISLSYRDAVRALNYRLVYGDNSVIYIDHVEKTNHEILNLMNRIHDHMEYFKNVLATGKAEEAFLVLDKITGKLQNNPNITYHYIQQVYVQLLSIVLRTVIELNIAPEAVTEKISDLYEGLFTKESYNELNQWFRGIIAKTCEEITKKMSARNKHTIQKALEYMKQHCHENISQTDVAEHICLNASYFSRYFRDKTGFSFMDYMKKLRIEKAKELLKSGNMKVYEISEALGYQSVQYFSTLFKGLVGLKPQEYKETAGNEGRG